MKVKVGKLGIDWSEIKKIIAWATFLTVLAVGAFGWGYIYRDRRIDNLESRVTKIDDRQKDMSGRLIAIEGRRK